MDEPESGVELPAVGSRRVRRAAAWLAAAGALCALLLGMRRVAQIEQHELERETEPQSLRNARALPTATRLSARLAEVRLGRDERAVFELCAQGALASQRFRDAFEILILHAEAGSLMLRVPLDADHQRHVQRDASASTSCLLLGSGLIEHSGTYRVEAVWPERPPPESVLDIPLWVHIQASPELARTDLANLLGLGAAALIGLALLLSLLPTPTRPTAVAVARSGVDPKAELLAPAAALTILYLAMQWPTQGGLATMFKGCVLLVLQLSLPFVLLSRTTEHRSATVLGLTRIAHPAVAAGLAGACVPVLVGAARLALRIVPSTEVAPIQTFIAWPGGMLSAALLGVALPLGEELFFRGYLLGVWLRHGRALAATVSVLAFGLMHLEQSWGNWGGLLSIFLTGAVLCALRLITGSCALSAASHVAYNLTLSANSLAAALDT